MSPTRIFSLCLIAGLSLTALVASEAQALPKWMTPPAGEPTSGEPAKVSGKVEKALVLLSKVGLIKVEIACEGLTIEKGLLEVEGKGSATSLFNGCVMKANGVTQSACKPHSPGAAEGTILTNPLKGSLVLHTLEGGAKDTLLKLMPQTGTIFATVALGKEVSSECAYLTKADVTGTLFARDSGGELEVEAETHQLEASTALNGLLFGGNAATLDGAVRLDLTDIGSWSGLAD
jgi:hypothetical protein